MKNMSTYITNKSHKTTRTLTTALLLAFLPLAGCESGTVETSDIEDFGPVETAMWTSAYDYEFMVLIQNEVFSFPVQRGQEISLLDTSYSCDTLRSLYREWDAATDDFLLATDGGSDSDAVCAEVPEFLETLIDITTRHPGSSRSLSMSLQTQQPLEATSYSLAYDPSDPESNVVFGDIYYSNPGVESSTRFEEKLAAWNPETCAFEEEPSEETSYQSWYFSEGTLDVETLEPGLATSGRFDAIAVEEDGTPAGTVSGTFDASFCNVDSGFNLLVL